MARASERPTSNGSAETRMFRLRAGSRSGLDLEREQGGAEGLALGVGAQRHGAAAAERAVQEEIQGAEVGQFEALDGTLYEIAEVAFDAFGGDFASEHGIVGFAEGDDADVAGVALVAGAGMRELGERHFHGGPLGVFSHGPSCAGMHKAEPYATEITPLLLRASRYLRAAQARTSRPRFRAPRGGLRRNRWRREGR